MLHLQPLNFLEHNRIQGQLQLAQINNDYHQMLY